MEQFSEIIKSIQAAGEVKKIEVESEVVAIPTNAAVSIEGAVLVEGVIQDKEVLEAHKGASTVAVNEPEAMPFTEVEHKNHRRSSPFLRWFTNMLAIVAFIGFFNPLPVVFDPTSFSHHSSLTKDFYYQPENQTLAKTVTDWPYLPKPAFHSDSGLDLPLLTIIPNVTGPPLPAPGGIPSDSTPLEKVLEWAKSQPVKVAALATAGFSAALYFRPGLSARQR
jgi:hypothetical protein